jgi:putative addiction module component (TIGR02574 family)
VTKPLAVPPPGFDELSVDEKLEYLSELWQHVVADGAPPVTDEQRRLLAERWARHQANPEEARPWSEVRTALEAKYRPSE